MREAGRKEGKEDETVVESTAVATAAHQAAAVQNGSAYTNPGFFSVDRSNLNSNSKVFYWLLRDFNTKTHRHYYSHPSFSTITSLSLSLCLQNHPKPQRISLHGQKNFTFCFSLSLPANSYGLCNSKQ